MATRSSNKFPKLSLLRLSWHAAFGNLPVDYTCFDIETAPIGANLHIVRQVGYCIVKNKVVAERNAIRLGWENLLGANKAEQYIAICKKMGSRDWHLQKAEDPKKALVKFHSVLRKSPMLVSYNGWAFDVPIILQEFESFNLSLAIRDSKMIDAGAIVKAAQSGITPVRGDTYKSFTKKALSKGNKKLKWSLHNFWYANVSPTIKSSEEFHSADTDSYLTHLVIEWFRGTK